MDLPARQSGGAKGVRMTGGHASVDGLPGSLAQARSGSPSDQDTPGGQAIPLKQTIAVQASAQGLGAAGATARTA